MQGRERVIRIDVGQVAHALLFHEIATSGQPLQEARDDLLEQTLQLVAGGRTRFLDIWFTLGAPIDPVEHQTVQMDVHVGGRAEPLDEGDRAGVGCGAFQACLLEQRARDDPVDDAQHRREQIGPCGKEDAQPDRKRQHLLPDRQLGNHLIDEDRSALGHAPRTARGAKPAPLAGKRHQLLVCAVSTAHVQKSVRQNAALEKGLELVPDERGQCGTVSSGRRRSYWSVCAGAARNAGLRSSSIRMQTREPRPRSTTIWQVTQRANASQRPVRQGR